VDQQDERQPAPETGDEVAERLGRVEAQLADFHRRSAHRETVIDRLHAENQQFRDGLRRVVLEPVVTDLVRLYDSMVREADRVAAADPQTGRILASYADEVELAVERCGYQLFPAVPGEAYQSGRHAPVGTVTTADQALDDTVADSVSAGLVEIETGTVRRPARARFHRYAANAGQPIHPDQVRSE
jgi:hypothetical protein